MKKEIAKSVMGALLKCHQAIDEAEMVCREIPNKEEREKYLKAILEAGGLIYTDAMFRIIMQHPELNPYPSKNSE
jgi:hypothetical protein